MGALRYTAARYHPTQPYQIADAQLQPPLNDNLLPNRLAFTLIPWPSRPDRTLLLNWTMLFPPAPTPRLTTYTIIERDPQTGRSRIPRYQTEVRLLDQHYPYPSRPYDVQVTEFAILRHANGHDLWLLFVRAPEGFRAIRFSRQGLDTTYAVVSTVGRHTQPLPGRVLPPPVGYSRLLHSADQRTLVFQSYYGLERFTFDPATGQVSRPLVLAPPALPPATPDAPETYLFPAAVSPGGRYYYRTRLTHEPRAGWSFPVQTHDRLWQYDLLAPDSATFRRSARLVYDAPTIFPPGSPQVPALYPTAFNLFPGPDGRLYCLRDDTLPIQPPHPARLDMIECPDQPAPAVGYRTHIIPSPPTLYRGEFIDHPLPLPFTNIRPRLELPGGLPNVTACPGRPVTLRVSQPGAIDSVRWDFGDGSPPQAGFVVQHTYPLSGGPWTATATYHYGPCGQDTLQTRVTPAPLLAAPLLLPAPDSALCADEPPGAPGAALVLRARPDLPAAARLRWRGPATTPADTLTTFTATRPGTYVLSARLGACPPAHDSLTLAARACDQAPPNVITPNHDGRNDGLPLDWPGAWTLEIFDRWGRRRWQSAPGAYRSGEWQGQNAAPGTYFYLFTRPADGRRRKGWVQVVVP